MFDDINEIEKAISVIKEYKEKAIFNKKQAESLEDTTFINIFEHEIKSCDLAIKALEEKIKSNTPPDFGNRTMSLEGGIDMYRYGKRYKSEIPPKGRKVKYLDDNGYDADRKCANKLMKKGDILTVHEIYVGCSSSDVEFEEFPGKHFNTVMFEDEEG